MSGAPRPGVPGGLSPHRGPALLLLGGTFLASWLLPLVGGTELRFCLFHALFELPCPGCGLGRSFCALTWGDPLGALRFHLLGPLLYLIFAAVLGHHLLELACGRRFGWPALVGKLARPAGWVLLLAFGVAWAVRLGGLWPLPE